MKRGRSAYGTWSSKEGRKKKRRKEGCRRGLEKPWREFGHVSYTPGLNLSGMTQRNGVPYSSFEARRNLPTVQLPQARVDIRPLPRSRICRAMEEFSATSSARALRSEAHSFSLSWRTWPYPPHFTRIELGSTLTGPCKEGETSAGGARELSWRRQKDVKVHVPAAN